MSGAGTQPAGTTPAGVGEPHQGDEQTGVLFEDTSTGDILAGRAIDHRTGDYTFTSHGRIGGMTEAQQNVLLAVKTDLGTSAVRDMGNRLRQIRKIGVGFQRELEDVYASALARLTNAGTVQLESVTPTRIGTSGAYVLVRFRDLLTNTQQSLRVT